MKALIATICILGMIGMVLGAAVLAADTGTVAATVTVQNISLTVTDGAVAYGTIAVSATKNTTSSGVDDTQVATNNGNVAEKFDIKGANTTGCVWTLAATADANQYFHKFCTTGTGTSDPCDAGPIWNVLTTAYATLAASVVVDGTQRFDLQIGVPTSSTCYTVATAVVTVQATLP